MPMGPAARDRHRKSTREGEARLKGGGKRGLSRHREVVSAGTRLDQGVGREYLVGKVNDERDGHRATGYDGDRMSEGQ
jgi:hypothetical protein